MIITIKEETLREDGTEKPRGISGSIFRVDALLLIFSIVMALVIFGETIYGTLLSSFLKDFGIELTEMGVFFSVFSLTFSLVLIPAGYISDRIGRNIITIALFALAVVVFSYTLTQTRSQLLLLRSVHGGVRGVIYLAALPYIMDKTTKRNRGQTLGMFILFTSLAGMGAPFIGRFLVDQTESFISLLYIGTIIPLSAAFFFLTRIRDLRPGFTVQKTNLRFRKLFSNKIFLIILLMVSMLYFATSVLDPTQTISAIKEHGMSYRQIGNVVLLSNLLYYISQFVGASLSDQYGRKNLLVYPLAVYAAAVFVAGFSTSSWIFFTTFILRNIGAAPYAIVAYSLIGDTVAQEHRGTAVGVILFVPGIIGGALNLLLGPTIEALTSLQVQFFVCSAVVIATIVMLSVALPQDKKPEVIT